MTEIVEAMLRRIQDAAVVVDPSGRALHVTLPQDPNEEEQEPFYWLQENIEQVKRWVASLGSTVLSNELIVVDSDESWRFAIRQIQRATWPTAQDSPRNCELMLMSWAWWTMLMRARGKQLDRHYAGVLSRICVPGAPDLDGNEYKFAERVRVAMLPNVASAARVLDASFDMSSAIRAWAMCWARSGFCRIEIAPKACAALAISDAPADVMAPWEAFSVMLPPDLCPPVRRIWCMSEVGTGLVALVSAVQEDGKAVATSPGASGAGSWATEERHRMLCNVASGAAIAVENGTAEKQERKRSGSKTEPRDGPPEPTAWRLAAELRTDFRHEVSLQWSGVATERRLRSQFPVRGHYRNQACGEMNSQRKRIWIHPFWKGDRTAVALLRRVRIQEPAQ